MVVVHPHEIRLAAFVDHGSREPAVHFLVARPVLGIENAKRREVVEKRPDDLVREAVIEVVDVDLFELNAAEIDAELLTGGSKRLVQARVFAARSGPANAGAPAIAQYRDER